MSNDTQEKPVQTLERPATAPPTNETPESLAMQSLEQGESSRALDQAEAAAADERKKTETLAVASSEEQMIAPEAVQALQAEVSAEDAELQQELSTLRSEYDGVLQGAGWRKEKTTNVTQQEAQQAKTPDTETKTEKDTEAKPAPVETPAKRVKQKVHVLGGETIAIGAELAPSKTPDEWKHLAQETAQTIATAESAAQAAHAALTQFESDRQPPLSALEESYLAYARTAVAEAETKVQYEQQRAQRLHVLADVAALQLAAKDDPTQEKTLTEATERLAQIDSQQTVLQQAMDRLTKERERTQQSYEATTSEQPAVHSFSPSLPTTEKSRRIITHQHTSIGLGMAALGILGVRRAANGALDFADTMFGHAINLVMSPGTFLPKLKQEFAERVKRRGAFKGTASAMMWTMFGGPAEHSKTVMTKEEQQREEQATEEKRRATGV